MGLRSLQHLPLSFPGGSTQGMELERFSQSPLQPMGVSQPAQNYSPHMQVYTLALQITHEAQCPGTQDSL